MRITVNDLAFEFPLYEQTRTMAAVKKFMSTCRKLESIYCHNVERLVRSDIDKEKEIYPGGNLYRIVREIEDRDDRKYFLGLLVNREKISQLPEKTFVYKNKESFACAMAREGMHGCPDRALQASGTQSGPSSVPHRRRQR